MTPPQGEQRQQQRQQSDNPFATDAAAAPHHRHPLDAWRISALNLVKFLFFFDNSGNEDGHAHHHRGGGFGRWGGGVGRDRAATEGFQSFAAADAARPRRPSEPACRPPPPPPPRARVRFSHQIRVILVASRVELSSVKADVWWGEEDYCNFRYVCMHIYVMCRTDCLLLGLLSPVLVSVEPGVNDAPPLTSDVFR